MEQSRRSCADFLNQEHPCACGRIHHTALQCVEMGAGAIAKLPARLKERGYQSVLIVEDRHTDAEMCIRDRCCTVDSRCAITSVVRPRLSRSRDC